MTGSRLFPFGQHFVVLIFELGNVHHGARQHIGIAGFVDLVLPHHLTDHDFHVLVVDFHALGLVDAQYLLHQIMTGSGRAGDPQDIMGVQGAFGEPVAHFYFIPFGHMDLGAVRNVVGFVGSIFLMDDDEPAFFLFLDFYGTSHFCQDTRMFRFPGFEQFFDTGKTLGDIVRTSNTAGVEGSHGQLGTRFADGLGSDGADGFAHFHLLGSSQVPAIAGTADPEMGFAGQYGTDLDFLPQVGDHISHIFGDVVVDVVNHFAILVGDVFGQGTTHQTIPEGFQHGALVFPGSDGFHIDTVHFIVPDLQFFYGPVFQDLFNHVSGELVASLGQDFVLFVDDVFFHLFVQEMVGHMFPESTLDLFFRHVDGQGFRFFIAFFISRIQADFQDPGSHQTVKDFFRDHRIGFCQDGIIFRIHHTGGQSTAHHIFLQLVLAGPQDGRARSRTRFMPVTSQSSSRTITSWATSTRRRVR